MLRFVWTILLTVPLALAGPFSLADDETKPEVPAAEKPVESPEKKPDVESPEPGPPKAEQPEVTEPVEEKPKYEPLEGFATVEQAVTAKIDRGAVVASERPRQPGYLGVSLAADEDGNVIVEDVASTSPAAKAGLEPGDVLVSLGGSNASALELLRERIRGTAAGETVEVEYRRDGETVTVEVEFAATSRPVTRGSARAPRGFMGVQVAPSSEPKGLLVRTVTNGSAADEAELEVGDVIVGVADETPTTTEQLVRFLGRTKPGDELLVKFLRKEEENEVTLVLGRLPTRGRTPRPREPRTEYNLAVVPVEYPDVKHNAEVRIEDWTRSLFSEDEYTRVSATGQIVFGSARDYFDEVSNARFELTGKVFDWVEVSKNREDYAGSDVPKSRLLGEAVDLLLERDGEDALDGYDGIFFLYAGGRFRTSRGGLYWPHRSQFRKGRKSWPYFIVQEGGRQMSSISVICHEFGHMIGLPDLYAKPERPGSEGVSVWCAMSNQAGYGRPQHFSAWCKEQLGWLDPVVVDPRVKQKLVLAPVIGSSNECYKVLVRPDGSEYLLLENRRREGFDKSLPASGLLVWRVVNGRPVLEESHGIAGPAGPGSNRDLVPFPSKSNDAFTPYTTPSSESKLVGGWPVHVTNIRELDDGRITFFLGYEFD